MKVLFFLLSACLAATVGYAQLKPSKLFGDHMVLQRNRDVPIWGVAGKRARVKVTLNDVAKTVTADSEGNWKISFAPMKEGGPYTVKISSGKELITYTDVMLGEVWICSGQSNMEFQMKNAYGYRVEKKNAANIPVRQFMVPRRVSLKPETALTGGEWKAASANTLGDFTAVGYFYAKRLAENLHVTVGLINSSWGGTEAEDWISRDAMQASPGLAAVVPGLPEDDKALALREERRLRSWVYQKTQAADYTTDELAAKPAAFFDSWQQGYAPGSWEWTGKLYAYRGEGFMQRTISLDSSYSAEKSSLSLGGTSARVSVYINGKRIDSAGSTADNKFSLPGGTWKGGLNSLVVNFTGQKDTSRFDLGLAGPAASLFVKFSDTTVNLADNKWRVMPDLSKPYHFSFLPNNSAFTLYNAMINPLVPYAVAGIIWYQGESNVDRAYQYREVLSLLINNWRDKWKQPFPFLFVQLSSYGGTPNSNTGSSWAELREAQNMALKLPGTGTAVTIDVGDPVNIHPRDKAMVGYRLAASAFNFVYHVPGFYESPQLTSADFSAGYALINFKNAESGLSVKDKYGYLKGFEIAGADHKFYYAQAMVTGNQVKVWSIDVPKPVAVRYAWTDSPVDANLYSKQGLPVNPFRTDNWDGITVGKKFE